MKHAWTPQGLRGGLTKPALAFSPQPGAEGEGGLVGTFGGEEKEAWSAEPRPDEREGGESQSGEGCRGRFGPEVGQGIGSLEWKPLFPIMKSHQAFELFSFLEGPPSPCWALLPQPQA